GMPLRPDAAGGERRRGVGTKRQHRYPANGDLAGIAHHQVQAGAQYPVDVGARRDRADVGIVEQRQQQPCQPEQDPRDLALELAEPTRAGGGAGPHGSCRLRHTRRAVAAPARPSGLSSRTMMKTTNTATAAKIPPTRKLAACWNRPSANPPIRAPRLEPMPPNATGTKP